MLTCVGVDGDEVLEAMRRSRVDPTAGRDRLVEAARTAGHRGSLAEALELVDRYRARPGAAPLEIDPGRTVGRLTAAQMLDRSVQRVDQLRRSGDLEWARRADGTVAITLSSIERRIRHRSHGARLPFVRRRTEG